MIYVKTTETCNLNCRHCFTNGSSGARIFWNPQKVLRWVTELAQTDKREHMHIEFHGGEPMLAEVCDMEMFVDETRGLWKSMSFGIATNLTYKLKEEHKRFFRNHLSNRIATSWDPDIRFANPRQYDLWRSNVRTLLDEGMTIKLFVSLSKGTINIDPEELLLWLRDLGVQEVAFERLTKDGNALNHPDIFLSNKELDLWYVMMHRAITKHNARDWFVNDFFESIYDKMNGVHNSGTFCRDCEEKLYTINADGSLAGCPNSAPTDYFGHIDEDVQQVLKSPQRLSNIACERQRDERCYSCEFFIICNSDCHQLAWEGDICPAPKTLYSLLSTRKTIPIYAVN